MGTRCIIQMSKTNSIVLKIIILPHSREYLNIFFQILHSHHSDITSKSCIAEKSIDFLDTIILKGRQLTPTNIWTVQCTLSQQTLMSFYTSPHFTQNTLLRILSRRKLIASTDYVTIQVTDNSCSILIWTLQHG